MESANIPCRLDHHQEQQQPQLLRSASSSSSSLDAPSAHSNWYGASSSSSSNHFAWSPNSPHMNVGNRIYQNINAQTHNTRSYTVERDENDEVQIRWSNNSTAGSNIKDDVQHQNLIDPTHDHQPYNKSKLNLFNSLRFPKFTNMISSTQSSIEDLLSPDCYMQNDHFQDLNQHETKLLIKPTLHSSPSGFIQPQYHFGQFLSNVQQISGYGGSSSSSLMPSSGTFSQIFPSVNISNLNNNTRSNSMISGSLDMNLQALDLLQSARFGGGISHDQAQTHHLGLTKDSPAFWHQHVQQVPQRQPSSPNKSQPSFHGESTTDAKRLQTEPKPSQVSSKKSRSESRTCPPFKVRKEKLGDRIAALQQLVAPFGKTDTASVLMEAIGYIKFLQNQVETLSVPYMKSSRNIGSIKPAQMARAIATDGSVEYSRRDLRSRGLCLVPLSCMSYVTNDDGGGWPSSEYHGAT